MGGRDSSAIGTTKIRLCPSRRVSQKFSRSKMEVTTADLKRILLSS